MFPQLQHTLYHKILRVTVCVAVCLLVFDSGIVAESTKSLSNNTQMFLANAVSVSVGVPKTEMNTLTAEITKLKEERDLAIGLSANSITSDMSTFVLSVVTFILLVLVILNYALDFTRARDRYRKNERNISVVV